MRAPSKLPVSLRSTPFAVGAEGAAGAKGTAAAESVTRGRARAADLITPFRGVRDHARSRDQKVLARAFAPLLEPDQVFSHLTAAALHGMRTPERHPPPVVHVTTFGGRRPIRRAGVSAHRGGDGCGHVAVRGLPVLDPVETWLHLASSLELDDLIVMGDGLVRRKAPVTTLAGLGAALDAHRRLVGGPLLREALEWVRAGTDSARETMLRLLLVRAGLPEPDELNGEIRNEYGAVIAHGDLVWREARVIVEYEGDQHRADPRQFAIDIDRVGAVQSLGWTVIRVDAALFARRNILIPRLRTALMHAPPPRSPSP